jgi:hypothetical protein
MIGVIGPSDSTALALKVASEEGLGDVVIVRAYTSADEAPLLAKDLDEMCQVLLFTGRVPHAIAQRAKGLRAKTMFVPHSGADLYRTLVQLLREFKGDLPRVSLDTIDPHTVREAFEDLGLPPPDHVLALEHEDTVGGVRSADDIAQFHIARYRAGDVDACLTCLGAVYSILRAASVPAWRISHTRTAMREALRQAHMAARLAITEATQPAAVLVRVDGLRVPSADRASAYDNQRRRLRAREEVIDFAERLHGRLAELDDETFVVYTSRGAIEDAVSTLSSGRGGPLKMDGFLAEVHVGVGLGSTVPVAEENARRALAIEDGGRGIRIAFADGEIVSASAEGTISTYRLREVHEPTLRLARQLGLGPLALTRLVRALRQVDASGVTASELARAYGIQPRSTRRIITSLQRAGIATPLGRHGGTGAGRPQTVYRIDLDRLVPADSQ